MGILSFFSGIASFLANIISAIFVLVGTLLLLTGSNVLGLSLFVLGCLALAAAELFSLFNFYNWLGSHPQGLAKAALDFVLFIIGALFFPILFLALYLAILKIQPLLILAITGAAIALIKIMFRLIRIPLVLLRR